LVTLLNNSDDHELVLAIADGCAQALEHLYDRHGRWMFSLARRFVTSREDSEEVVQDVFAQVWREAARYDAGKATVATWLGIMARSRALDRVRARRCRPVCCPEQRDATDTLVDAPDPEQHTIIAAQAVQVRSVLHVLPPAQRDALDLAFFQGLSHSEIARQTGTPLGTIKTRLRSALATLRLALEESRERSRRAVYVTARRSDGLWSPRGMLPR